MEWGGVGKTQLATFLLHQTEIINHFGIRLWFRTADSISFLSDQFINLAQEWGLVGDKSDLKIAIEKIHNYLLEEAKKGKPWFIVFDNAEEYKILEPFIPKHGGHVLITTRIFGWKNTISINVMNENEGRTLVNTLLQRNEPEATSLCNALGLLPLGIVQACAYIKAENLNVTEYLQLLSKSADLLGKDTPSFGKFSRSILGMWEIVFQKLISMSPKAFNLLEILALLSPDAIPQKLLHYIGTPETIEQLQRYALLEINQGVGSVHRLLQLSVRVKGKDSQAIILTQAMHALSELYVNDPTNLEALKTNHQLYPHGESVCQHYEDLKITSDKSLQIAYYNTLQWLGDIEGSNAYLGKQKSTLEKALVLALKLHGEENVNVATCLHNLAEAFRSLGDAKSAQEYHVRALAIRDKIYGKENVHSAQSLSNLGLSFQDLGDAKKAQEHHLQALAIYKKIYSKEPHPDVAKVLNNLGVATHTLGNINEAIEYYKEALSIRETIYGPVHFSVAQSLNCLAESYYALENIEEARLHNMRALTIRETIYGSEHPSVAQSLNNLGSVFRTLGDAKTAVVYHKKALKINKKIFNVNQIHPRIANNLNYLGLALQDLNDIKSAVESHKEALDIYKKVYSPNLDHPSIKQAINYLNNALQDFEKTTSNKPLSLELATLSGSIHPESLNNSKTDITDTGALKEESVVKSGNNIMKQRFN